MRMLLIIALALGIVACQNLPPEKTATSVPIGPEFATPTDKLPESTAPRCWSATISPGPSILSERSISSPEVLGERARISP